jgi:hypothetical protein
MVPKEKYTFFFKKEEQKRVEIALYVKSLNNKIDVITLAIKWF